MAGAGPGAVVTGAPCGAGGWPEAAGGLPTGAPVGGSLAGASGGSGEAQPASPPRISAARKAGRNEKDQGMWVIVLEALAALALLVFIVWWTMFSGRRKGEPERPEDDA